MHALLIRCSLEGDSSYSVGAPTGNDSSLPNQIVLVTHSLFVQLCLIQPQLYSVSWTRLLFGRMFPPPLIFDLWDYLFDNDMHQEPLPGTVKTQMTGDSSALLWCPLYSSPYGHRSFYNVSFFSVVL
jgi:hypothetical protein